MHNPLTKQQVRQRRNSIDKMDFQRLFALGMKRRLPKLLTFDGPSFDIGASGKYVAPGAMALGPPQWVFPRDPIPAADASVATIHCYHFLEHLCGDDAVKLLREVERVLIPDRGVMNFSVPYFYSALMAQNLQHKSLWCEETFRTLFEDDLYENYGKWKLRVHFLIIAAVAYRNLALIGQIIKSGREYSVDYARGEKWFYPIQQDED